MWKIGAAIGMAACAVVPGGARPALADGTIAISTTTLQTFKGWGIMPAPYDRQMPTFADGSAAFDSLTWLPPNGTAAAPLHQAMGELNFDIARVYISPTVGRSDHTLDAARLQDLKDNLALLRSQGARQYILCNWSPPAYMKLPDRVRYGAYQGRRQFLNPAFTPSTGYGYADYIADVTQELKRAGFAPPLAISIQNEPSVAQSYDGCVWTDTPEQKQAYRNVVKRLRARLDAQNMAGVALLAPEEEGLASLGNILGPPSGKGFAELNHDPAFGAAIGGFSFHTYATAGNIGELTAALAVYGRDRWMTEYSTPTGVRGELRTKSGSDELDWAFNDTRRMAGDIIDLGANYWFFWRGWHQADQPGEQDLLYGSVSAPKKTKAYYVFQTLWKTVKPGWKVKRLTTTEPDLRSDNTGLIRSGSGDQWSAPVDLLAFENPRGDATCLLLANWKNSVKQITALSGLKGTTARTYVTTTEQDMKAQARRSVEAGTLQGGALILPPYSITLLVTSRPAN